jgi:hypothetical protein
MDNDVAGSHLAIEHSKDNGACGIHQRVRQRPKLQSLMTLQAWVDGEHEDAVIVHNSTARVFTVRLVDGERSLMKSAYKRIQDAHPFMKMVTQTVEKGVNAVSGERDASAPPVIVIEPTNVGVVPLPPSLDQEGEQQNFALDFAYGMGDHVERSIGRMPVKTGSALSFLCLNRELHINNQESLSVPPGLPEQAQRENDIDVESVVASAVDKVPECTPNTSSSVAVSSSDSDTQHGVASDKDMKQKSTDPISTQDTGPDDFGEATHQWEPNDINTCGEKRIEVANRDFAPVTFRFYRGARMTGHMFDTPFLVANLAPGEEQVLIIPSPEVGTGTESRDESQDFDGDALFEIEVQNSTGKFLCNARGGQVITHEGCL